jgi:hypothetical protein
MGALWLFFGGSKTSLLGSSRDAVGAAYNLAKDGAERLADTAQRGASVVGGSLSRMVDAAGEAISEAGSRAADVAQRSAAEVGETISSAGSQAADAVSSTVKSLTSAAPSRQPSSRPEPGGFQQGLQSAGRSVQQELAHLFERQPLALGAVGLAIGAAIAAAVPATDAEKQMMGEASGLVKDQAKKFASGAVALGGQVVDEIKREAEVQGLTPAKALETVETVKDKLMAVGESARQGIKDKVAGAASPDRPGNQDPRSPKQPSR